MDARTAHYSEFYRHCRGVPSPGSRRAESDLGEPVRAASNLLAHELPVYHGHAELDRVSIAGENIACRVAGSTLGVCNIYFEEPNSKPCGQPFHRQPSRLCANEHCE